MRFAAARRVELRYFASAARVHLALDEKWPSAQRAGAERRARLT